MKVIEQPLFDSISYDLHRIGDPARILFFDIETTGLSAFNSMLYLIGAVFMKNGEWTYRQWFVESLSDEAAVLRSFFDLAAGFDTLITFNGDNFDLRYLRDCASQYGIRSPLQDLRSLDLMKAVRAHRRFFGLEHYTQKSVENFLGVDREDLYSGGELISVYQEWQRTKDPGLLRLLLLHNADDIRGMTMLLPILSYCDALALPKTELVPEDVSFNKAGTLLTGSVRFRGTFPIPLTRTLSCGTVLQFRDDRIFFSIPSFTGELKYFYPNAKDYYFLPAEDMAIHKKVAVYVDKSHRIQATPRTCYTRLEGRFLRAGSEVPLPKLRPEFEASEEYVQYEEDAVPYLLSCMFASF